MVISLPARAILAATVVRKDPAMERRTGELTQEESGHDV